MPLDWQRARGYEVEKLEGGIIAQIRKLAPLIVPVTINAIVGGEDIIDAMGLRCFGIGKRTWLQKLKYKKADWALIASSVAVFVGCTVVRVALPALGYVWVPQWIVNLATMR
jgi:energy-coupling factor transport system permease protein